MPTPLGAALTWVACVVAMIASSIALVSVAALIRAALGKSVLAELGNPAVSPLLTSPLWFIAGAVTTQLTVAAVLLVALRLRRLNRALTLPVGRAPAWSFAGALLVVFGLAPLAQVVGELTSRLLGVELKASLIVSHMAQSTSPAEFALLLVCLSVLPGLIEEAMFRGYITAAYRRRSLVVQALVPSLLFGLFHLEPTQAMATIVLGVGFALARLYTGSLLPSMVAHAIYNATVLSVARSMPEAEDHVIRFTPLAVGAALFAAGFLILRATRAPSVARSAGDPSAAEPR